MSQLPSIAVVKTGQFLASDLSLTINIFGVVPRPWPTVAVAPVPVQLTILNPLVVLAETVEVIEPSVFDAVVFEANQFHDTFLGVPPLSLNIF